jgi:hypothetical protein
MRTLDHDVAIRKLLNKRIEQIYPSRGRLVACSDRHPLVKMAHDAFCGHRPIAISPDDIWFCLAQGFAAHVNLNAEKIRKRLVRHEGKLTLSVTREDFKLGRKNPWLEVVAAFSDQIAMHTGRLRELIAGNFSTTTMMSRAAFEICWMDTFQADFKYEAMAGGGIPAVTLLGTVDDWREVRRRAQRFGEFDLTHWTDVLLPVLDVIIATAHGNNETEFWQSMFHCRSSSRAGDALSGWLQVLFPYITVNKQLAPNPYLGAWRANWDRRDKNEEGPSIEQIPSGLVSAQVQVIEKRRKWNFKRVEQIHQVRFVGGMFGVGESLAGVLAPEFGWAIVYD